MRIVLSLVLLMNLQLIHGFGYLVPIVDDQFENYLTNPRTYGYEQSGIDENGNPFLREAIVSTNFQKYPQEIPIIQQELPQESGFDDYFQPIQKPVNKLKAEENYFNNLQKAVNEVIQTENELLGYPEQKKEDQWKTAAFEKIKMPSLNNRLKYLAPESATHFNLPMPGLGPFHFEQKKPIQNKEQKQEQFIKRIENKIKYGQLPKNQDKKIDSSKKVEISITKVQSQNKFPASNLEKFEKEIENKEQNFLSEFDRIIDTRNVDPSSYLYLKMDKTLTREQAFDLLKYISELAGFPMNWFRKFDVSGNLVVFKVDNIDLDILCSIIEDHHEEVSLKKGYNILSCSRGNVEIKSLRNRFYNSKTLLIVTITVCVAVLLTLITILFAFTLKRKAYLKRKLIQNVGSITKKKQFDDVENLVENESKKVNFMNKVWPFKTKQVTVQQADLCRSTKLASPINATSTTSTDITSRVDNIESTPIVIDERKDSNRTSTSSWSEEPIASINMDISTGHAILSYMEDHLNDKNRLDKDWEELCQYEVDRDEMKIAKYPENISKNRYSSILPYDHNRVKLQEVYGNESDYINASFITDDDPKNPAYIATQGPLAQTTSHFWQMVWEQNSVTIVSLCRTMEYGSSKCNQYWPTNGFETYNNFEIHLVSEHVWCEEYLVRSIYLKNKLTNQTRTVTQFQFLSWPENGIPSNIKSILDFRRKVNKSYNRKSYPIIVHCNDGIGRTGTYIMIDMILNKITKEVKEIDLAATLEYMRDQRIDFIKNKNQFEFSFAVITEEVQNMLKTLIQ